MCHAVHQFGLVGGTWYDSKEKRLEQLLERVPPCARGGGAVVFVVAASAPFVGAIIERCRNKAASSSLHREAPSSAEHRKVASPMAAFMASTSSSEAAAQLLNRRNSNDSNQFGTLFGAESGGSFPAVTVIVESGKACTQTVLQRGSFRYAINYDLPASGREYLRRLTSILPVHGEPQTSVKLGHEHGLMYTCVEESEMKNRRCREIVGLLKRARRAANDTKTGHFFGGVSKACEFDACMEQLEMQDGDEDEEEEVKDEEGNSEDCDCAHCRGGAIGGTSYHSSPSLGLGKAQGPSPGVEVVRVPLRALEDLEAFAPLIAPRLPNHVCTLICLHCLNVHTPWDGWEHLFASPELGGSVRVVLVLAEGASWHEYPDFGTLCAGGVTWLDILDVDSMDRADVLLERLVAHEAALLGGHSERVVLMGMSQGGGQSMLRFLRSKCRLGGWVGTVCHPPIGPHTPRDRDPLLTAERSLANCDRPIRLLAGQADSVFTAGLILRDAARLREVGGFTDVEVLVQPGLKHEGFDDIDDAAIPKLCGALGGACLSDSLWRRAQKQVPELLFVRQHLPAMIGAITPRNATAVSAAS